MKKPERVGSGICKIDGRARHPAVDVRVVTRCGNYSAFNGYHFTPSDYSAVQCRCGAYWRTNARYVGFLRDGELL